MRRAGAAAATDASRDPATNSPTNATRAALPPPVAEASFFSGRVRVVSPDRGVQFVGEFADASAEARFWAPSASDVAAERAQVPLTPNP